MQHQHITRIVHIYKILDLYDHVDAIYIYLHAIGGSPAHTQYTPTNTISISIKQGNPKNIATLSKQIFKANAYTMQIVYASNKPYRGSNRIVIRLIKCVNTYIVITHITTSTFAGTNHQATSIISAITIVTLGIRTWLIRLG